MKLPSIGFDSTKKMWVVRFSGSSWAYESEMEAQERYNEIFKEINHQIPKKFNGKIVHEMCDWKTSFSDNFAVGDYVDDEIAWELIECLPPRSWTGTYFQCGEPASHKLNKDGNYQATYLTLIKIADDVWEYKGNCFAGKKENQV